ncbi:hypothetical protein [Nocardia cyriacigeorgica]|uniref:hypothetical protein n=1 Tax=Nocardia cyriacigeorgica TaxID=135487 RepID=UPI0018956969|nr:hypothetical protein [Nocardia cyriacigeorgica]MBF6416949.1 hypothetical protein [Nocardia cyriacigeorgica]
MHITTAADIARVARALEKLITLAAQDRAAYEDGNGGIGGRLIEDAFEAALDAGASKEVADHAYRIGFDWGDVPEMLPETAAYRLPVAPFPLELIAA